MSRKKRSVVNRINADPKFHHFNVAKFINCLMLDGNKAKAEKIFYSAMDSMSEKIDAEPVAIFEKIIGNVKPIIEVRSRRVGGATYQVPVEVRPERSVALAIRWIIDAARKKKGQGMARSLFDELLDGYNNKGEAMKKRETAHKMAEANRSFAHYKF